jgi:sensor domain CHASE-containing protein
MSIRPKVIAFVAILFAGLIATEIFIQEHVLLPSFAALERNHAHTSMNRIRFATGRTLEELELTAADWGNWADVYQYITDRNPAFVAANITPVAMKQLKINSMMIVDSAGNNVLATARDIDTGQPMSLDWTKLRSLPADFPWRANLKDGRSATGFIRTDLGVMMIAGAPILNGSGGGRSRGMIIVGRLLTPEVLKRIGGQAQASVSMAPLAHGGTSEMETETENLTRVFGTFLDVYGMPVLTLRVDVPREITARGRTAVLVASGYLVVAAIAVLLLLLVVLNRVVLHPLARVTEHAVAVGRGRDLTSRLVIAGNDEIARLATEFNRMCDSVAESRRQLVDQSFQSGFAELARGVMHNIGNAMTPVGVRLAALGARLRATPLADLEQAAAELAVADGDPARRADLVEFIRLGCRHMQSLVEETQADVDTMTRQTGIVQSTLSEQMRTSRTEEVVESVRLPELIAQSLEIVPDECRERLRVETDESLSQVGVVRVARTVLRLILQNLIINASDAVRDTERGRGTLRVAAAIVHEADGDQLHLRCEDDGIGIAPERLELIFQQGFSTKSRRTNHGIGLHWCANALAALGGRIWAASAGPGLGASLHVILPLHMLDNGRSIPST